VPTLPGSAWPTAIRVASVLAALDADGATTSRNACEHDAGRARREHRRAARAGVLDGHSRRASPPLGNSRCPTPCAAAGSSEEPGLHCTATPGGSTRARTRADTPGRT